MESIGPLEKAIELDPKNVRLWNNLGLARGVLGELDKKIQAYEHSLTIDIRNKTAWFNLLFAYGEKGDDQKVLEILEKITRLGLKPINGKN